MSAQDFYELPPLQRTSKKSVVTSKMPNGYLVSFCDGETKTPSVRREFKPNPEVQKRLKSLSKFHHTVSAQLGTKTYFENSQKPRPRKPSSKRTSNVRASQGFKFWYDEPASSQVGSRPVRNRGQFGAKNTILGIGGGSSHISRQPVNALHFSKPTGNLENMIRATAPLQWIGATIQQI